MIPVATIKDLNRPVGVNKTIGQVTANRLKEIGASNKAAGVSSSNGEAAGRDTVRARTARDTVSRDTATVIGATGTNSITTTSIGASNSKADRPLQLAAKL